MCKNWYRLRVGLMTLVALSVTLVVSSPVAHAGKTPPPPTRPVNYSWTPMPVPAGISLAAKGMNNNGEVLTAGEGGAYLWRTHDNAVVNLVNLILNDSNIEIVPSAELWDALPKDGSGNPTQKWPPGAISFRFDFATINDGGQIAAQFNFLMTTGATCSHAFRYTPEQGATPAQFIDLGTPDGWADSFAKAINKWGEVVGHAEYGPYGSVALLWMLDDQNPAYLVSNEPFMNALIDGHAYGINDVGQVTGNMLVSGSAHAFRYDMNTGGSPVDLGVLYSANPHSLGRDINNNGQVVGISYVTRPKNDWYCRYGTPHAFRFTDGKGMVDLGALTSGGLTSASHINSKGNVIGSARSAYPSYVPTWFLYTDATGMLDVLKLVVNLPSGANGDNFTVSDINDYAGNFGQICGTNAGVPFILTPDK